MIPDDGPWEASSQGAPQWGRLGCCAGTPCCAEHNTKVRDSQAEAKHKSERPSLTLLRPSPSLFLLHRTGLSFRQFWPRLGHACCDLIENFKLPTKTKTSKHTGLFAFRLGGGAQFVDTTAPFSMGLCRYGRPEERGLRCSKVCVAAIDHRTPLNHCKVEHKKLVPI